jgi:hypothetical protein
MRSGLTGPAAAGGFGLTWRHLEGGRLFNQFQVTPAVFAAVKVVLALQLGEQSDGDLHVALAANSTSHGGHTLLAAGSQAVVVLEDLRWELLAKLLKIGTVRRGPV